MTQQQLFDAGNVRTYVAPGYRGRGHRSRLRDRLVGHGWIRVDPETGRHYELDGKDKCRIALPWPCSGGCGTTVYRSRKSVRRSGNPTCSECVPAQRARSPVGACRSNSNGYVEIKTEDGWELQHRVIMAAGLGRPLFESETVHHINGDRSDNRFGNLQLRQGQHGSGVAMCCLDCGSSNVAATALEGGTCPS